jgi:hypothetical protein
VNVGIYFRSNVVILPDVAIERNIHINTLHNSRGRSSRFLLQVELEGWRHEPRSAQTGQEADAESVCRPIPSGHLSKTDLPVVYTEVALREHAQIGSMKFQEPPAIPVETSREQPGALSLQADSAETSRDAPPGGSSALFHYPFRKE